MLRLMLYFAACSVLSALGQAHDDFLVCKPIGSLFEMQQTSLRGNISSVRGPQGPPGKRGVRGFPGPAGAVGPVGKPGIVDWKEVDNRIESKLQEIPRCRGIWFNQSCFWLPLNTASSAQIIGKAYAENVCAHHNGTLIDIESKEMYDALYLYVQQTWNVYIDNPTWNFVDIWTALTIRNGKVISSSGGPAFTKWYPGYPTTRSAIAIAWVISTYPSRAVTSTGFHTTGASFKRPVPLCNIRV